MRTRFRPEPKPLGEIRTSQLITSYGVGAMVDFRNETAILAGADDWAPRDGDDERIIHCHNLEKILDRDYFVSPKYDKRNRSVFNNTVSRDIGAYRFPNMLYCPSCNRLHHDSTLSGTQQGELRCPSCGARLVPSRFVVVCRNGHIDDFPYSTWVHKSETCPARVEGRRERLRLYNMDERTSLGSLIVKCDDCGANRSMQQAFVASTLGTVYRCSCRRPWLTHDDRFCNERPEVRMRTATGVYMPVNVSALNIPPWSGRVARLLERHMDAMEGKNEEALRGYVMRKLCPYLPGITAEQILSTYRVLLSESTGTRPANQRELYEDEYQALCKGSNPDANEQDNLDFCTSGREVPEKYKPFIAGVTAVDRLTEVVAMVGFTRLQAWNGDLDDTHIAPIFSGDNVEWLPAIELRGEGIFIQLDEERVTAWEKSNAHIYTPMMKALTESGIHCENASARYVLLHTLAHLLIRSLSSECGYQAASMKERIYSTYGDGMPMAGILIYTASSDTDGSLGGLVAQAEPEHISQNIDALLREAEWCSADPLCMTSTGKNGQGLFGLNYAACHQCALLPETSCAMRNVLLDRAALIGRDDDGTSAFFDWDGLP